MVNQAYDVLSPVTSIGEVRTPIIFLHGIFDSKKTWKKTAPAIVRNTDRKAYLLDARNHGESSWDERMDYDILTSDVINFMDEQSIRKAVVLGNSMGGRTAINLALKHPSRVDMLIVEDMTPNNVRTGNDTVTSKVSELVVSFLDEIPTDMDEESARQMIMDLVVSLIPEKLACKEKVYRHYDLDMIPLKKVGNKYRAQANIDSVFNMLHGDSLNQKLPESGLRYDGDALFVYGSKGFFNMEKDTSIKKLFPKAIVKRIEGGSHLSHCDSPDEFVKIVSDFILRTAVSRAKY